MEQYSIREYRPNDGMKISSLFTTYVPYIRDEKFWVWINRIWGKESIVTVAVCNNEIVGHYAILPHIVVVNSVKYQAGLGIHAFVSPEHSRNISIFQITSYAYQLAKNRGLSFIYGFPNQNYRLVQEKIERWNQIQIFNALEVKSAEIQLIPQNEYIIEDIKTLDFSDLYNVNTLLEEDLCSLVRIEENVDFWLSRYVLHPQSPYVYKRVIHNGNCVGYFVCKYYKKQSLLFYHVVDFVLKRDVSYNNILSALFEREKDCVDYYSCWKGNDSFHESLLKLGFTNSGFDTYLGVKFLDKNIPQEIKDYLLEFKNWHLVMGNSDAF